MNLWDNPQTLKKLFTSLDSWILFFIIGLGTLIRLHSLNNLHFHYDEMYTYREIFTHFYNVTHPRFPIFFYKVWIKIFGEGTYGLRLISVIWSVASIYLIYVLGKMLNGRKIGLIAAFLLSVMPTSLTYAQMLRPYAQFMFFSLIFYISYVCSYQKREKKYFVLFGLASILCFFTHQLTFFLIFTITLTMIIQTHFEETNLKKQLRSNYLITIFVSTLIGSSWLTFGLFYGGERTVEEFSFSFLPLIEFCLKTFVFLGPGTTYSFSNVTALCGFGIFCLACVGFFHVYRHKKNNAALLFIGTVVPITLTYFALGEYKFTWEWERYLTYATVPYIICIASGIYYLDFEFKYKSKMLVTMVAFTLLSPGILHWYVYSDQRHSQFQNYSDTLKNLTSVNGVLLYDLNIAYRLKVYRSDNLPTFLQHREKGDLKFYQLQNDGHFIRKIPFKRDDLKSGKYYLIHENGNDFISKFITIKTNK